MTSLQIAKHNRDGVTVVAPDGILDLASYARLRDMLISCAMEVPRALVVDVGALDVPTPATLAVFSTVRMRVAEWPGVPLLLVASEQEDRRRLLGTGISRHVPVHASLVEAMRAVEGPGQRRRAIVDLPAEPTAPAVARRFVLETCADWDCDDSLVEDAVVVANALVDNAIQHGGGEPWLRLELRGPLLTVAVFDAGPAFPWPDDGGGGPALRAGLGLMLVEGLASGWGCTAAAIGGKVAWAVLRSTGH